MNARTRILLALLGCLVLGGEAVAGPVSHCDRLCCDQPCDTSPLAPESCACCAVRSATPGDPRLPSVAPATPAPVLVPELPDLPLFVALTGPVAAAPARAAMPAPPRVTCLRL